MSKTSSSAVKVLEPYFYDTPAESILVECHYKEKIQRELWDLHHSLTFSDYIQLIYSTSLNAVVVDWPDRSEDETQMVFYLKNLLENEPIQIKIHSEHLATFYFFKPTTHPFILFDIKQPFSNAAAGELKKNVLQGCKSFVSECFPLDKKLNLFLEKTKIFSIHHQEDAYILRIYTDSVIYFTEKEEKIVLSQQDTLHLTDAELTKSVIFYKNFWWAFVETQVPATSDFWSEAYSEDIFDEVEKTLLKRSLFGILISFFALIPFLWTFDHFHNKAKKIQSVGEIELKAPTAKPPSPPKPTPTPTPTPTPKPKPKPKPKISPKPIMKPAAKVKKVVLQKTPPKKVLPQKQPPKTMPLKKAPNPPPVTRIKETYKAVVQNKVIPKYSQPISAAPKVDTSSQKLAASLNFLSTSPVAASKMSFSSSTLGGASKNYAPAGMGKNISSSSHFFSANTSNASGPFETSSLHGKRFGSGFSTGVGKSFNNVQAKASVKGSGVVNFDSNLSKTGSGAVADAAIMAVLSKNMQKFQFCYEKALLVNPSLSGQVVVQWTLTPSGKVQSVNVIKSQIPNNAFKSCLSHVIQSLAFPAPKGGAVTIEYPFNFSQSFL